VIAGDYNADPFDGDSTESAIMQLLKHPLIDAARNPESDGAKEQAENQGGANNRHRGNARLDTADFSDSDQGSGNLRIDYVLPSNNLTVVNAGVFWPKSIEPNYELILASDHRMVWIDVTTRQ
jgi:hypothetical protein